MQKKKEERDEELSKFVHNVVYATKQDQPYDNVLTAQDSIKRWLDNHIAQLLAEKDKEFKSTKMAVDIVMTNEDLTFLAVAKVDAEDPIEAYKIFLSFSEETEIELKQFPAPEFVTEKQGGWTGEEFDEVSHWEDAEDGEIYYFLELNEF